MKKNMNKFVSGILAAAMAVGYSSPVTGVFAEEDTDKSLYDVIKEGICGYNTEINISQFGYSIDGGVDIVNDTINDVIIDPDMYFFEHEKISMTASKSGNGETRITKVKITYKNTLEDAKRMIAEYNAKADEIISCTITNDMTDMEKALKLHDYLVLHTKYDLGHQMNPDSDGITSYDIICNNAGVCQGYAQAYKDLLRRAGVESIMVSSDDMNHAWNMVKIDDNWYHVDVTWDDPVPDYEGRVKHTYFMMSDETAKTRGEVHYNWNSGGITADDNRYDNMFWSNVSSEIFMYNGKWYYIDNDGVYSNYNPQTNTVATDVCLFDGHWKTYGDDTSYWLGSYMSMIVSGDTVYYNTPDLIFSMRLDGSWKQSVQYVNPIQIDDKPEGYVYGMVLEDNILYAVIKKTPSDTGYLYKIKELNLQNYSYISSVISFINNLKDGESGKYDYTEEAETVLPTEAVSAMAGRKINVSFDFNEYAWNINGENVKKEDKGFDLSVKKDQNNIPWEVIDERTGTDDFSEINLRECPQIPATVTYKLGTEYAAKTVEVYSYDKVTSELNLISEEQTSSDGTVEIDVAEETDYAVVIKTSSESTVTEEIMGITEPGKQIAVETEAVEEQYLIGDVNNDGNVDLTDLSLMQIYTMDHRVFTEEETKRCDCQEDGIIDIADVAKLKMYICKQITSFR